MADSTARPPEEYLGVNSAAAHLGLSRHGFLQAPPPPPDALIDTTRGWRPATLEQWNASRTNKRARITNAQREAMLRDLHAGHSVSEVARTHGVSRPVVSKLNTARKATGDQ